ncbi:hypothetical protein H4R33_006168 [Dimargaris cristalligena]|uniref:Uncharacterized protein n=1 Tax=Dimargaris cristalligena TaxID=215637 RepID=A0A4P9ZN92_9FUNG|nr:hypothetical protein H4R33_006168 [Dimargaris cristalligena]RKP34787.1 hypothetical protein BJ085DRAFT_29905 [Dimargaris cristalligena]|eukprot:RKP34787.1 hypothetical protein BJ085DRAFT_29905 [Dimargaris cristalligena]
MNPLQNTRSNHPFIGFKGNGARGPYPGHLDYVMSNHIAEGSSDVKWARHQPLDATNSVDTGAALQARQSTAPSPHPHRTYARHSDYCECAGSGVGCQCAAACTCGH